MRFCPKRTITSPACKPFSAAGLVAITSVTTTASSSVSMPYSLAKSAVSCSTLKPKSPNDWALDSFVSDNNPPFSACSSSPRRTCKVISLPLRIIRTSTSLSTSVSATIRGKSRIFSINLPSKLTITSPASIPDKSAGPPSLTFDTKAPAASTPRLSAISSVTSWIKTPSQPLRVRPYSINWSTTCVAKLDEIAKPIPTDPPV